MKKYFYLLFVIPIIISGCKEDECSSTLSELNLTGIYNANFLEDIIAESTKTAWERNQIMKIVKENDTLYHLCVYDSNACILNTMSDLILSNSLAIKGNFYFPRANGLDWQHGTLEGYYNATDNTISGIFTAETLIIVPPDQGSDYLIPIQGTFEFSLADAVL